jgi:hypothetical protein
MSKNLRKIVEVENPICKTFSYYNFLQISTDFELFKPFRVKAGLSELCSHRPIATPIANPPELHYGKEVLYGGL